MTVTEVLIVGTEGETSESRDEIRILLVDETTLTADAVEATIGAVEVDVEDEKKVEVMEEGIMVVTDENGEDMMMIEEVATEVQIEDSFHLNFGLEEDHLEEDHLEGDLLLSNIANSTFLSSFLPSFLSFLRFFL